MLKIIGLRAPNGIWGGSGHTYRINITQRLYAVVIKGVLGMEDKLSWKGIENGKFMVGSAYSLITKGSGVGQCMERFFDRFWKVVAP